MRVLVVDDDEDIREVVGAILRSEGHQVDEASDGIGALDRLRAGDRPSIILLDLMMPRLDGEGFLKAMRDEGLRGVPVFFMSGYPGGQRRAEELGAAGCLSKPIELDQLLKVTRS